MMLTRRSALVRNAPLARPMPVDRKSTLAVRLRCMLAAVVALFPALSGADCRAVSPDHTVALIELYTSEGCDSCPPADRWFSALALGPTTARSATLAFHVDYWDRLGVGDRFGNAAFTARHHEGVQRPGRGIAHHPHVPTPRP